MQSLLPKDDEPIKPIQPPQPQQQAQPQYPPPQGYNYPPPNYPPPNYPPQQTYPPQNYPPQGYAPQQPQPQPQPQQSAPVNYGPPPAGSNLKTSILMGAVVALIAACGYLFYQVSEVRSQVAETKEALLAEIEKIHETSSVTVQTSKRNIEAMEKSLAQSRAQAAALSGQAKIEAEKHADEIAVKLEKAQAEQGQKIGALGADVSQVKDVAAATSTKVGEVTNEVGTLKTDTATNKSAIEKTIADLKSARGDLGIQSGLIATNGKELQALKQLGERNYIDFKVATDKHKKKGDPPGEKVGDIRVVLKNTDPKKNTFDIQIVADDKTIPKPKSTALVPVQFVLSKSVLPYELVVMDVKKDLIVGYLSVPKVQQTRGSSSN
ncbi:MAG TPA: hypothetical protein VK752_19965 [Bryobacteraceae bacterium]|jgi:hypothetical protein|nr:hypothetical protein [Bryobacteraceae bacterium]